MLFETMNQKQYIIISTCPPGLYCVIDEFITEYDLRLLEEEERAEIVANRSNKIMQ